MLVNSVYIKKLTVPVYKTSLWIVVSDNIIRSIDAVEDMIDKVIVRPEDKKTILAYTYGYQDHTGKMRVVLFATQNAKPGTIAHEANHALNIVLSWNGVKPSFTNDETECYYLEYIVDKVHAALQYYILKQYEAIENKRTDQAESSTNIGQNQRRDLPIAA
jgi:hypothetical protein